MSRKCRQQIDPFPFDFGLCDIQIEIEFVYDVECQQTAAMKLYAVAAVNLMVLKSFSVQIYSSLMKTMILKNELIQLDRISFLVGSFYKINRK